MEKSSLSRETTRQARFYPRPPHLEFEASTTWPHMSLRNEVLPVVLLQIVIVNHETHLVKNHESQSCITESQLKKTSHKMKGH